MTEITPSYSGVVRASALLALGNIISRALGLAREVVLSNLFGASRALEAFNNAVVVSRSVFDLLIAGHVSGALIPVLSEIEESQGRDAFDRVLRALAGLVLVAVGTFALLIFPLANPIAQAIGGDDWQTLGLTTELLRLTSPAIILLCLFGLYSGALYALGNFRYPAMAATVFNGTMVVLTLISGQVFTGEATVRAVSVAWIIAAAVQLALQLWGLRGSTLWPTLALRDPVVRPALKKIGRLYMPVIGVTIFDILTTRFLTYALAAVAVIAHGNTYMNWATTLVQFPQGLVATAISAAVLPTLSRMSAKIEGESESGNIQGFMDTLGYGLRLTTLLILPAAIGLAVLAEPVIRLIFENGQFTGADTAITAIALRLYLIGLPFAAWDLLLVYGFYAKQDTATPASIGVLSLIVYAAAALILTNFFGLYALMMADSIKHITHALVSGVFIWRRVGGLHGQRLIETLWKSLLACAVMAVVALILLPPTPTRWAGHGDVFSEFLTVLGLGVVCMATYFGMTYLLRVDDLRGLVNIFLRRSR
jgi:putative peptidoglycan lipid II flippase